MEMDRSLPPCNFAFVQCGVEAQRAKNKYGRICQRRGITGSARRSGKLVLLRTCERDQGSVNVQNMWNRCQRASLAVVAAGVIAGSVFAEPEKACARLNEPPSRFASVETSGEDHVMFPVTWEGFRSINSMYGTVIAFHNGMRVPVDVNWVNYSGREVNYAIVPPGETYLQPTFASHSWTIREHASQSTLALAVASEDATVVSVSPDEKSGAKSGAISAEKLLLQYVEEQTDSEA